MEIVEEARNDVLLDGSDNKGRARFVYRFFPGDDRGINETKDEEYLNVFRGDLHIRVERCREDLGYCVHTSIQPRSTESSKLIRPRARSLYLGSCSRRLLTPNSCSQHEKGSGESLILLSLL